jgi:hypothetical protein
LSSIDDAYTPKISAFKKFGLSILFSSSSTHRENSVLAICNTGFPSSFHRAAAEDTAYVVILQTFHPSLQRANPRFFVLEKNGLSILFSSSREQSTGVTVEHLEQNTCLSILFSSSRCHLSMLNY